MANAWDGFSTQTRVRPSSVGPSPRRRVIDALARFAGVSDPVLVPDDREAYDAALLLGRTLAEVAPDSPARRALQALAAELAGLPAAGRRERASRKIGARRATAGHSGVRMARRPSPGQANGE